MNFSRLRQHQQPWALALLLALLLLTGWGSVHRTLHPGAHTLALADAGGKASASALAHEDGGSLCHLLDHLSHGAGPTQTVASCEAVEPPPAPPARVLVRGHALSGLSLQARGPPTRN